jgi:hypothetical protein
MVVAGTVYTAKRSNTPAVGAIIRISDSSGGKSHDVKANAVGNFYITVDEWPDPVYPMSATIDYTIDGVPYLSEMVTKIGRNAGCGRCHQGDGDESHAQRVYANEVKKFP